MTDIKGKTVVITGAASGLGKAWTEGFLADGANVVAADINVAGLAEVEKIGASIIATDVTSETAVAAMIDHAVDVTGRIDVLFNNAGVGHNRPFEDIPAGEFEHHVAIHLHGAVYGMRYALPRMKSQGYGRIINTISRAAEIAAARNTAYAAAKAALWATSVSVAREAEGWEEDIIINMLIPGPTNTAIWGRDMPNMQSAEVTYPTARMLAGLPKGTPQGRVFWDEKEYSLFKNLYDQ